MFARKHKVKPFQAPIKAGGAGAVLARLIRTTMYDLGIDEQDRYDSLMVRYIQKARFLPDAAKQEIARVGLSKELLKEAITWKTLLKGYEFLNIKQVGFGITFPLIRRSEGDKEEFYTSVTHIVLTKESREDPGKYLASLLAKVFHDLGIVKDDYDRLMDDFINNSRSVIHKRQRASIRASISKELLKGSITWKTFMKGLVFLNIAKFKIETKLYHANKQPTFHEISVVVDGEIGEKDD